MTPSLLRTVVLAIITMLAFALNSVFGRLALSSYTGKLADNTDALAGKVIDPASYTGIRLISGAIMLAVLASLRGGLKIAGLQDRTSAGSFFTKTVASAFALFAYATLFSFAYISVDTGTGALILFACVQATMIGWGIFTGERPTIQSWTGILMALGGFFYLVSPGLAAPDPVGAALMAGSGIAWGIYSLKGQGLADPLQATTRNFIVSVPFAIILLIGFHSRRELEFRGVMLAIASGGITSALGYALWYETLKGLTATKAAIVQLTVPVIATLGGILILSEPLTKRYVIASVFILGGVALCILAKEKRLTGDEMV